MIPKGYNRKFKLIPSNKFENIDINEGIVDGNTVHFAFRAQVKEKITNAKKILDGLPVNAITDTLLYITSTDRYANDSRDIRWAFISNNGSSLSIGGELNVGTWIHISWTYIKA